jgi:cell division protein FtsB
VTRLLILGVLSLSFLAVMAGVVFLLVFLTSKQSQENNEISSLEEENHRLREEIDGLERDKS